VGMGSDKVVDLDFVEDGLDDRSAPSAAGSNLLHASATPSFTMQSVDARAVRKWRRLL
jgi:hypothetical protein